MLAAASVAPNSIKNMRKLLAVVLPVAASVSLLGCASELERMPVGLSELKAADARPIRLVFTQSVTAVPPSLYRREIKAGTQWQLAGRVPQGLVYRPVDSVFMLEGANVHEAYLVVADGALVGAYLPVERAFVTLERVKPLPVTAADQ